MILKNMKKKWSRKPRKKNEDEEDQKQKRRKKRRRYEQNDVESKEELREFLKNIYPGNDKLE
jgi:phage-related minor tail protein